jgi:hypothetical protein
MKHVVLRPAGHYWRLLAAGALLALSLTGLALAAPAMAAPSCSVTWIGNPGGGSWSTASNWSTGTVPGPASDVCIPGPATVNAIAAMAPISVNSVQLAAGASLLIIQGSFSIATSLTDQGFVQLTQATLSAGSVDVSSAAGIGTHGINSITSPAFSNAGTVTVGVGGTLSLADNPVQLQNGTLSGGSWLLSGGLFVPGDISQITGQGTQLMIDGIGIAVWDSSGKNALATLTAVGSGAMLAIDDGDALSVAQGLTSQGIVSVGSGIGGALRVNGAYTLASGGSTSLQSGATLSATSVSVGPGSSLGGQGTVAGSVTNNGTVAPGNLTVTGNYTQTAGAALTEQFGLTLKVSANATLSGALNVTGSPKRGASYTALTFGSLNGSFTSQTAGYTLTINANNIKVTKQ